MISIQKNQGFQDKWRSCHMKLLKRHQSWRMEQPVCLVTADKDQKLEEFSTDTKDQFGRLIIYDWGKDNPCQNSFKFPLTLFTQSKQDSFVSWRIIKILSFNIVYLDQHTSLKKLSIFNRFYDAEHCKWLSFTAVLVHPHCISFILFNISCHVNDRTATWY